MLCMPAASHLSRARQTLVSLAVIVLLLVPGIALAESQVTANPDLWITNGPVNSLALSGNTLYIAGDYTRVATARGCAVPISTTTGSPAGAFPQVNGWVTTIVPDGANGWFLGGWFKFVNGQPRSGLAHVLADGSLAPWNPRIGPGHIQAIAVDGNTVYVGGYFFPLNAQDARRSRIAAIDATTGAVLPWNPTVDGGVTAIAVTNGVVFVAGEFDSVNAQPRRHLAAITASNGILLPWIANTSIGASVTNNDMAQVAALCIVDSTLYVAGAFDSLAGQPRLNLGAVSTRTGLARSWDPQASGGLDPLPWTSSERRIRCPAWPRPRREAERLEAVA